MRMLKIPAEQLPQLYALIAAQQELYLPVKQAEQTDFALWQPGCQVDLDTLHTVKSPKELLFPQVENLAEFAYQDKKLRITPSARADKPYVIFGVKACDLRSFTVLDKVFLAEPADEFYQARRNMATIVSLACTEPEQTCFCCNFDIKPQAAGADIDAYLTADTMYLLVNTDKGQALADRLSCLLAAADEHDAQAVEQQAAFIAEQIAALPLQSLPLPAYDVAITEKIFQSPVWEKLYLSCLGCGTCTFVCPTCHCYDVQDFDAGSSVSRFRCWDSCMFSDFTNMAHGNPRSTRLERFRQRYMHKLTYFPQNNDGTYACVGCGRCLEKCPINMNIVKVIKALEVQKNV